MQTTIVIPCHNEAERLDVASVRQLLSYDQRVLLVDDGSTDGTWPVIEGLLEDDRISALRLPENVGKGEAIRRGMSHAIVDGAELVGYLDADFATPASEMLRLVSALREDAECTVLLGSRWLHLGARISRTPLRHYVGRVFATVASLALKMPVYDTQCGAKVFRVTPDLKVALSAPFSSRWAFDVELLGRLRWGNGGGLGYPLSSFQELSLREWTDVRGSSLNIPAAIQMGFDVVRLWWHFRPRRKRRTAV